MRVGVREICDVVLKAKANQKLGNLCFKPGMPVMYFETAKTSSLEGAATTVYAQGGKGNSRLIAWEGEKTLTFTLEDALISPLGFAILSGSGLVEATAEKPIMVHQTTDIIVDTEGSISVPNVVMDTTADIYVMKLDGNGEMIGLPIKASATVNENNTTVTATGIAVDDVVRIDYYVKKTSKASEITITPDKFAGFYYLEASTLFRKEETGEDLPAEFVIPKVKIQSNWTFSMAATGDPSTFTFTMDAFPDYTKFDKAKKVLAILQVIDEASSSEECSGE